MKLIWRIWRTQSPPTVDALVHGTSASDGTKSEDDVIVIGERIKTMSTARIKGS